MSALERAVAVMDRLRSPGGCPWDAEQTHESLAKYLLEEAYETLEAIETGDHAHLREELGDLLLQVLFHARLAEEHPDPFSIEDVAGDLVDKLVRRHPHVFGDVSADTPDQVNENWEKLKAEEKGRSSVTEGVPMGQPALSLAAKLVSRATRAGLDARVGISSAGGQKYLPTGEENAHPRDIGARLFEIVREAVAAGVDPEAALRATARDYRDAVRAAETA